MVTLATERRTLGAIARLQDKVKRLNRRAIRLGQPEMVVKVGEPEPVKRRTPAGLDYTVWVADVTVEGCAPRINGWEVVARIEFTDAGNLVHYVPGITDIDHRYRAIGNECEHCNTIRRRNDIIVIRHSDGRELCVGRNCLADFVRTDDTESLMAYASIRDDLQVHDCDEDSDYRGGRVKPMESVETILRAASICIRKLGWRSASADYDDGLGCTKDDVLALLYPPIGTQGRKDWEKWIKDNDLHVSDYDRERATNVLEWLRSVEPGNSNYLENLKVLAQLDHVGYDKFGYLVSAIIAYEKHCEHEVACKERDKKKGQKVYWGSPKKRERNVRATCKGIHSFDGHYGVTTIVRFEHRINDAEYAVLVWFASGDRTEEFDLDEEYTFDATCKDHNDHETYGKQTRITRVTVKS